MPKAQVVFFQEANGEAPVLAWLQELLKSNQKAWANCRARIELLSEFGHKLRRPATDYLREGIRQVAILAHGLTKEEEVPAADIDRALKRKKLFAADPKAHTYET